MDGGGQSGDRRLLEDVPGVISTPNAVRILAVVRRLLIESPPRAKKLSAVPTLSMPSTSDQIRANASSVGSLGATYSAPAPS